MAKIVLVIEDAVNDAGEEGTRVTVDKELSQFDGSSGDAVTVALSILETVRMMNLDPALEPESDPPKFEGNIIPFPTDGRKDH